MSCLKGLLLINELYGTNKQMSIDWPPKKRKSNVQTSISILIYIPLLADGMMFQ